MGRPKKARPEDGQDPDEVLAGDRAEMGEEEEPEDDPDMPPDDDEDDLSEPGADANPVASTPPTDKKASKKTVAHVALEKATVGAKFLAELPKEVAGKLEHGSVEGHRYRVLASETRGNLRLAVYQGTRKSNEYRLQVDREGAFGQPKESHYAVIGRDEAQEMYERLADKTVGARNAFPL